MRRYVLLTICMPRPPLPSRPQLWINDPAGHTLEFQQAGFAG